MPRRPELGEFEVAGDLANYVLNQETGREGAALDFQGEGMRVELEAVHGLTAHNVLTVPFRFQVPPLEAFERTVEHSFNDYETISGDTIGRAAAVQLRTVTFKTMFLDYPAGFAVWPNAYQLEAAQSIVGASGFDDAIFNPVLVAQELEEICSSGTPFRLKAGQIALTDHYDVNMLATLRTLRIEERAGELDARYVDVEFTEFVRLKVPRRKLAGTAKTGSGRRGKAHLLPCTVIVSASSKGVLGRNGKKLYDQTTLAKLAKDFYGDASRWRGIAQRNSAVAGVGANASLGTNLKGNNTLKIRLPDHDWTGA